MTDSTAPSHGARSRVRAAARLRPDHGLRQPGLDRAADVRRLPGRLPLRAGPAGIGGGRHGRRLRPGHAQRRLRQPAFGGGRGPCDGGDLHRLQEPHADGHHRRAAVALDPALRPLPGLGAGHRAAAALRQVGGGAGTRRGRAAGHRPRLLPGDDAAARPGAGVGTGRRLGRAHRAGRTAARGRGAAPRPGAAGRDRRGARRAHARRPSSSAPRSTATAPGTRRCSWPNATTPASSLRRWPAPAASPATMRCSPAT